MAEANDMFSRSVVLQADYQGDVANDQPLDELECCYDIYYPPESDTPPPVVLMVIGFGDYPRKLQAGKGLKDLPPYISWAGLLASEGVAVVLASCSDPEHALPLLLDHLAANQQKLKLDMQRFALWACSGNGPAALNLLRTNPETSAAVFFYSYLADLEGHDDVAKVAREFGFCNPAGNRDFIPVNTPLFIVRAGKDQFAGLNETLDRYVTALKARDADVELVDYPDGVHGFDLLDDSAQSIGIIRKALDYLAARLGVGD